MQDNQDSNIFWVGTWEGLNKFDRRTEQCYLHDSDNPNSLSNSDIMGVAQEPSGLLWIATWDGGINILDPVTDTITRYPLPPDNADSVKHLRIAVIYPNPHGILWVSTWKGGLHRFDSAAETVNTPIVMW